MGKKLKSTLNNPSLLNPLRALIKHRRCIWVVANLAGSLTWLKRTT
jgi:hypothetical protein